MNSAEPGREGCVWDIGRHPSVERRHRMKNLFTTLYLLDDSTMRYSFVKHVLHITEYSYSPRTICAAGACFARIIFFSNDHSPRLPLHHSNQGSSAVCDPTKPTNRVGNGSPSGRRCPRDQTRAEYITGSLPMGFQHHACGTYQTR